MKNKERVTVKTNIKQKVTWECINCLVNDTIPEKYREHEPCLLQELCVSSIPEDLQSEQFKIISKWFLK